MLKDFRLIVQDLVVLGFCFLGLSYGLGLWCI